MYGLALCLPRVGQPQGLPVPREIPKNRTFLGRGFRGLRPENHAARIPLPPGKGVRGMGLQPKPTHAVAPNKCHFMTVASIDTIVVNMGIVIV